MDLSVMLVSVFSIAFFSALGHCIGMCGGIVLAYSGVKIQKGTTIFTQALLHLLYSAGRISSYMILGFIVGFLGAKITLDSHIKAYAFIFVGILLCFIGVSIVFFPKFLTFFELDVTKSNVFKKAFAWLLTSKNTLSFYALGVLNGFFPCGIVYFFLLSASVSGGALQGAAVMMVFGIATIPSLLIFGLFSSSISHKREIFLKITALFMVGFGVYSIYKAINMLNMGI